MKIPYNVDWNGFLENIVSPSRSSQESCAWIFAEIKRDIWHVLEVKNVGLKGRLTKDTFAPDKKEFAKIKRYARKKKWTRIGNVHTHVVCGEDCEDKSLLDYQLYPSDPDLSWARRFNDIVRAVVVVMFPDRRKRGRIYGICWFDQYGNILMREKFGN